MQGPWFCKNGELRPVLEAVVPIDDINYSYGYGVYETLKVRHGVLYFADRHVERLLHSAGAIGLPHPWDGPTLLAWLQALVRANARPDANLKVLLLGAEDDSGQPTCTFFALELNPLFPKRQDYRDGARAILYTGERWLPEAKTLNMLMSTLAYRQARAAGAYDAVLVDRQDRLTEGTRTNLFWLEGDEILTPPSSQVLAGVTRQTVIELIHSLGWPLRESELPQENLLPGAIRRPDSLFLTSTSTKIMPLCNLGGEVFGIAPRLKELMKSYDDWLESWAAGQERLV